MKMKKIIAMLLAVCCLLSILSACGGGDNADTTPETTLAPAVETDVVEPLTWEKLNALPVASSDMSEDELRQLCLDFMTLMMTFAWTPSKTTDMVNVNKNPDKIVKTFHESKVYGGTPYLTARTGNIYTAMEFYDERNGMLDLSGGQETLNLIGNQCSSSTFWAWNRVCASANHTNTANMQKQHGCLRVGPYTYDDSIGEQDEGFYAPNSGTDMICMQNGMQTMFESYAMVKPADGIVSSTQAHVQMIASLPNVVRDAAGNIDGQKSTVKYTDQDGQYYHITQADGSAYEHVGGVEIEVTFAELFMKHYIPFTFAELIGEKEVEKSETTITHTGETISLSQLNTAEINCNYSISDITYVIKDSKGKQVHRSFAIAYTQGVCTHTAKAGLAYSLDLGEYADGKHTIEISARIGTGEKPVVYTGTLVK